MVLSLRYFYDCISTPFLLHYVYGFSNGGISRAFFDVLLHYFQFLFMALSLGYFYDVISGTFLRRYFYYVSFFYGFFNGAISSGKLSRRSMTLFLPVYFLGVFGVDIFTTFPTALCLAHFHDVLRHYLYEVFMTLFLRRFYEVIIGSKTFLGSYFYDVFTIFIQRFSNSVISNAFSRHSRALFLPSYFQDIFRKIFQGVFQLSQEFFQCRHFYGVFQLFFSTILWCSLYSVFQQFYFAASSRRLLSSEFSNVFLSCVKIIL